MNVPVLSERGLVTVPDCSTAELIALARKKLKLNYVDPDYANYDFFRRSRSVAGRSYRVFVWSPDRAVTNREVRARFRTVHADGNPAAFIAWIMEEDPEGRHASLPSGSFLYRDPDSWLVRVPHFVKDNRRELGLYGIGRMWFAQWSFAAFR